MSKYAEKNLRREEEIMIRAKFSIFCVLLEFIWFVACLVFAINKFSEMKELSDKDEKFLCELLGYMSLIVGLIPLLYKAIILWSSNLVITNKRVIGKIGVLSLKAIDYPIEKVDHVTVNASIWGNIFRYATVVVDSANSSNKTNVAKFKGVRNYIEFKNYLTDAIEQKQAEARKAQAEEIAKAMGK